MLAAQGLNVSFASFACLVANDNEYSSGFMINYFFWLILCFFMFFQEIIELTLASARTFSVAKTWFFTYVFGWRVLSMCFFFPVWQPSLTSQKEWFFCLLLVMAVLLVAGCMSQ
jgi:hypothetical protein